VRCRFAPVRRQARRLELFCGLGHVGAVITITAPLWLWSGESGSWHFVTVPEEDSGELRAHSLAHRGGFGSVKVNATVNDVTWRTSVFPQKSGGYVLPVKKEVRCRAGITAGDTVTVRLDLFVG
jgi:hypothetical protein